MSDEAQKARLRAGEREQTPFASEDRSGDVAPFDSVELPPLASDERQIKALIERIPGGAANVQDVYPLSALQEGLLFHRLLNERSDTYILSTLFELQTAARIGQFVTALQVVVDRHDALRTAVLWEQLPRPMQVVWRRAVLSVKEVQLDPCRGAREQMNDLMRPQSSGIDLRQAPLMQLILASAGVDGTWYALLQVHHIICDHQSLQAIVAEALAVMAGHADRLPQPAAYREYVAQGLQSADLAEAETFFRSKLHDIDTTTAPFGVLDVNADGSRIEELRQLLDVELARQIREQARRHGTTPARLFHALWGLVVAATSGREEVVYGTIALAARQRELAGRRLLGMSVNTLPLCLRLDGLTAAELLQHTHEQLVEVLRYRHTPLTLAQRCSALGGGAPLFTTLFNFRHQAVDEQPEQIATPVRVLARGEAWSGYPLALTVDDVNENFLLTVQADRRIPTERVVAYVETAARSLLQALERTPQTPALTLSVVPETERKELLETFNATERAYPQEALVHELVEDRARKTPNAIAVVCGERQLSYDALNRRANQLAHVLRKRGVRPEERVALFLERDIELVIAMLASLKAGGAYVPLDVSYPAERVAHMLRNSKPVVTLTCSRLQSKLPESTPAFLIDAQDDVAATQLDDDLGGSAGDSGRLAYVIYTSGSTGVPKGVMVEHRSLVNLICWTCETFGVTASSRCSALAAVGFDAFTWETWPALMAGATLHVAPAELAADAERLLEWWSRQPLDVSFLPTPMAELAFSRGVMNATLRTLLVGGDRLRHKPVRESFALINNYGPTESTVVGTSGQIARDDPVLHIGRPITNSRIYVLNAQRQLLPLGAAGEIYIGGAAVARGYLDQPELTAQRFVRDPFAVQPDARMYRTGDLGRWRLDGAIEYLGRNDQQVKIRGFRIELGDIEAQLARAEGVRDAVVLARDISGRQRLVAYVVPTEVASAPSVDVLREHLQAVLPEYMIPNAFVTLERLPLTANGKLDRRALPEPQLEAYATHQYEPPRGELEQLLASIWEALLGMERVGRMDNFFELGGHSLLIVQLMERLRRVGISVELRKVFERPTLHEMASVLSSDVRQYTAPPNAIPAGCKTITPQMLPLIQLQHQHIRSIANRVPGGAANIQDIYPLGPLQEGILFHHLLNKQAGDPYVIATLLTVASRERLNELVAALQAVVDRHDILRTALLWEQLPRAVQVVYRSAKLPVEETVLDPARDTGEQLEELIRPDRQRLDIHHAPLMRLRAAADPQSARWYVLLQLHHLVADNASLDILISEAVALLQGRAQRLAEPVPYRNHVAQVLAQDWDAEAEAFFRQTLGSVDEPTAPFGLLDIHGDGARVEEVRREVPPELARKVREQARRLGVSAATLFHAAWALVIAKTSGRDDAVFGTVLLGRLHGSAGAQRILGMFINTLPLRLQLRSTTVKDLIEQTQRGLVDLLRREHAPLSLAQRCSGVNGSLPLFTALINYRHNVPRADWASADGVHVLVSRYRTNYPLVLSVDDLGEGFAVSVQADRAMGSERIASYLENAMAALVDALRETPQLPALSLDVLPPAERRQVLDTFNDSAIAYPSEKLIHQLFEEQVVRSPADIALVHGDATLTYAELDGRANRLAHYLRARGIGPDKLVGVCIDRSIDMVVAVLGVLKAGGAYLPLDPHYPSERLAYMLNDGAPIVVLTQAALSAALPPTSIPVVSIDATWPEIARYPAESPSHAIGIASDHLLYVIYTSGSTGRPKGTAMPHRAMVNLIEWHRSTFANAPARVLQFAALSFDVAFQDTFSTLCTGGTLVLLDEWMRRDARALVELLNQRQVERVFVPPLMLQSIAEFCTSSRATVPSLRDVIVAGEQLRISPEVVAFIAGIGDCRVHNHYGPTETHVVTAVTLSGDPALWPELPTIGRPIANTRIYILDEARQAVPRGVVGEIYIGGAGLARGYLRRLDLTEARFLPDPFSVERHARIYRTGDLGRWCEDGTIEYLGRNDDQVKIRGFRIELGEIEARVALHEDVKEVAVVAREDVLGEKRLVAYVTRREHGNATADELRAFVRDVLPEHMVPSGFVILADMPQTPSGKLDRRRLPAPDIEAYASKRYQAPQGEIEQTVATVFQELLQVERWGRDDNFFDAGGHSLLAMQVAVRVQRALYIEMPIALLFECPTVRQLARRLEDLRRARLFEAIEGDSAEFDELLEAVASMPESEVRQLLTQLTQS